MRHVSPSKHLLCKTHIFAIATHKIEIILNSCPQLCQFYPEAGKCRITRNIVLHFNRVILRLTEIHCSED